MNLTRILLDLCVVTFFALTMLSHKKTINKKIFFLNKSQRGFLQKFLYSFYLKPNSFSYNMCKKISELSSSSPTGLEISAK